jgi:hypothetical protein
MNFMTPEQAGDFAKTWLPAWTGNRPELFASFYTDDVFYLDPSVPEGICGKEALIRYLSRLLKDNPDWVWTQRTAVPLEDGFLNRWRVVVPIGDRTVVCDGVCSVQLRDGLIYRNEVYFDMTELLATIRTWNALKGSKTFV